NKHWAGVKEAAGKGGGSAATAAGGNVDAHPPLSPDPIGSGRYGELSAPRKGSAVALRRFVSADVVATRVDHQAEPAVQDPRATVAADDVVPEDQSPLATVLAPGKNDPRALRRRSL